MGTEREVDRDVEKMFAAARAARWAAVARFFRFAVVTLISLGCAAGVAWGIARWDSGFKEQRLADYKRGRTVVLSRGESVYDTSPSPLLVFLPAGLVALVVFAVGAKLLVGADTYLQAFAGTLGSTRRS